MPQNDHDYHNINAMHVHTKNDQDFDSAILHYCMFFANHSLMVVGIGFKLGEHDDPILNNQLYWKILPCVRDLQLYSMTIIVLVDQDDDYDDNHHNDNYNDDQGLYQSTHSLQWS